MADKLKNIFYLDTRSLAVFRICLGITSLFDVILRLLYFDDHYTDNGLSPIRLLFDPSQTKYQNWSLFFLSNNSWWAGCLFSLTIISALFVIFGFRTRISIIALWVLVVSIQARCPYVCFGADSLLRILLFWSMWLPLNRAWSLDSYKDPTQHYQVYSGATIALIFQVSIIYWFNAITKGHPMWRDDFSAVEYSLKLDSFSTNFGSWLLRFPVQLSWATRLTILLEEIGPILLFLPFFRGNLRTIAVVLFIFFHLVILASTMHLGIFPYISSVAWLPFLPTSFWEYFKGTRNTKTPEILSMKRWKNMLCTTLCIYMILWNIRTIYPDKNPWFFPQGVNWIGHLTRLDQKWSLFAPRPRTSDMWFIAQCRLSNGKVVDLFNDDRPPNFFPPDDLFESYSGCRERGFMASLYLRADELRLIYFANYLLNSRANEISDLTIYVMECDHLYPEKGFICWKIWPYEETNEEGNVIFTRVSHLDIPLPKP